MEELEALSVRLPRLIIRKIDFLARELESKNGFKLSRTSIVKTLLEEALINRGITDHVLEHSETRKVSK
jgi:hypothetical protein